MANEAVLTQCYVFTDKGVRLDPASTANDTAFLYLNEGADKHVVPEFTGINIGRLDDGDVFPEITSRTSLSINFIAVFNIGSH